MIIGEELYSRILKKKKELDKLRPFPKAALKKLKGRFTIEATYNSNAIEGNTLTLSETRLVIEEGVTIGGKSIREHFEAMNHNKAINFIEEIAKGRKINKDVICKINYLMLDNIEEEEKGIYRLRKVHITGASFVPPMPNLIPKLMKDFISWLNKNPDKLNIVELAAVAHEKFVFIHPFIDGNGRVARLLTSLILIQHGYSPSIILKTERKKYIRTLEQAHKGDLKPFVDFIGRSVERSILVYLDSLKIARPDEEYISLMEATKYCNYSQEYLSLLARKGRLECIKLGRNWLTTKKAIKDYLRKMKR